MKKLYADTRTQGVMTIKTDPIPGGGGPNIAVVARDGNYLALSISSNAVNVVLAQSSLNRLLKGGWSSLGGLGHLGIGGGTGWYCGVTGIQRFIPAKKTIVVNSTGQIKQTCDLAYEHAINVFKRILMSDQIGKQYFVVRQVYHTLGHIRH